MTGSMHGWFANSPLIAPLLIERAVAVRRGHCIGCWALNDPPGSTTVHDSSGRGHHGTPHDVTFGQPGIGGLTAASFDGSTGYVDVFSASLASAFSGAEGTLAVWLRVAHAGVWTDLAWRRLVSFYTDANNVIELYRYGGNPLYDGVVRVTRLANGTTRTIDADPVFDTDFVFLGASWSETAGLMRLHVNQAQSAVGLVDTWTGSLTAARLGERATGGNNWYGDLALVSAYDVPLTTDEMTWLSRIPV